MFQQGRLTKIPRCAKLVRMNENMRKAMGKRIRALREQLGLSQIELAKKVGKSSAAYIAFIESGERNISTMDMMLLAKKLGTTVAELVGEEDAKKEVKFMQALRSSGDLDTDDKRKIREFYDYLQSTKKKHGAD